MIAALLVCAALVLLVAAARLFGRRADAAAPPVPPLAGRPAQAGSGYDYDPYPIDFEQEHIGPSRAVVRITKRFIPAEEGTLLFKALQVVYEAAIYNRMRTSIDVDNPEIEVTFDWVDHDPGHGVFIVNPADKKDRMAFYSTTSWVRMSMHEMSLDLSGWLSGVGSRKFRKLSSRWNQPEGLPPGA